MLVLERGRGYSKILSKEYFKKLMVRKKCGTLRQFLFNELCKCVFSWAVYLTEVQDKVCTCLEVCHIMLNLL